MTEPFPSASVRPWAGTISHHLLTAPLIDAWFRELAQRRTIRTFYILSPSHGERTVQPWAVARGRWKIDGGWVDTDEAASDRVAARLGVQLEPPPFQYEHGVHVFMPYIRQYFPQAKVVAVVHRGEPPVDQSQAEKLKEALLPELSDPIANDSFLLVSTDFSHHGDEAQTKAKDDQSAVFWAHPSAATWILAGCDNRPGIYVLASLLKAGSHTAVLWHTNAYLLSGEDRTNITSYFFTWVW
jgi:AmmeMemoRadiSam system protein B